MLYKNTKGDHSVGLPFMTLVMVVCGTDGEMVLGEGYWSSSDDFVTIAVRP